MCIKMELAMQIGSTNQKVRDNTIQDLKDFNQQSLSTRAKKGEQLVSMMPAIKEPFTLMGNDIVDLSTENDALKEKNRWLWWKMVTRVKGKTFKRYRWRKKS